MLKSAALVALSATLVGCAGPMQMYAPSSTPFSRPPVGQEAKAAPGDALLSQGSVRRYDALRVLLPMTLKGLGEFKVPPGVYIKESENSAGEYFAWDEVTFPTRGGISYNGLTLKHLVRIKARDQQRTVLCALTFDNKPFCGEDLPVERTQADVADTDRFQQTLIYNGRVGNRISLGYREFTGSMARPAFSNQVDYDLAESKILVYQGAQIEVLDATNQGVTYRVLRNFNAAR